MTDPADLPDLSALDVPGLDVPGLDPAAPNAPVRAGSLPPPPPAEIDELARRAVSAGDETEAGQRWGELWRVVLPLERWFFVRDTTEEMRPAAVDVNGQLAIPVFTDQQRATAFAEDGHGGAERVFASPPEEVLGAAEHLESAGIALFIFNPTDVPFGAPPVVVRKLAADFAAAVAQAEQVAHPTGPVETEVDLLAVSARQNPTDVETQADLWRQVFTLEHWFMIPRAEGETTVPYAEQMQLGPSILAFTTPQRAKEYADLRDLGETDKLLGIPPVPGLAALEEFTRVGVKNVHFDPQHGSFFAPIENLRAMYAHATGTEAPTPPDAADAQGATTE